MSESVIVIVPELVMLIVAEFGITDIEVSPVTIASIVLLVMSVVVPAVIVMPAEPSFWTKALTELSEMLIEVPALSVTEEAPDMTDVVIVDGSIDMKPPVVITIVAVSGADDPDVMASI